MYIIYNNDGSVLKTDFVEFIQKGNNNVNKIFVKVEGRSNYDAYAIFKLPNGEVAGPIIGEWVNDYSEEDYPEHTIYLGDGMLISISQDVTAYAGIVKATIQVTDGDEENPTILYTYPVMLTINDTHIAPSDLTQANLSQYFNLKKYINESMCNVYDLSSDGISMSTDIPNNIMNNLKKGDILVFSDPAFGVVTSISDNYIWIIGIDQDGFSICDMRYIKEDGDWGPDYDGWHHTVEEPDDDEFDTMILSRLTINGNTFKISNPGTPLRYRYEIRSIHFEMDSNTTKDSFETTSFIFYSTAKINPTDFSHNPLAEFVRIFNANPEHFVDIPMIHRAYINGETQYVDSDIYELRTVTNNLVIINIRASETWEFNIAEGDFIDGCEIIMTDLVTGEYNEYSR